MRQTVIRKSGGFSHSCVSCVHKDYVNFSSFVQSCGGFDNYRNLSHYLREFSDFIHWYEQMFDRKPFIKKSL